MCSENNTSVIRIGLVLNDMMESLDALVHILFLVVSNHEATLVFELVRISVFEEEPGIPSLTQLLILNRTARCGVAEWIVDLVLLLFVGRSILV